MAETTAFADDETALRHGEELVSRLPTLAYYARNTPTETIRRRRGIINRVDVGDRRRTTTIRVRFTALDRPDYRTTAGIDMGKLLSKGLGRRPESSVILPMASTYDDLKRKAHELFPVLDGMAFDLVGETGQYVVAFGCQYNTWCDKKQQQRSRVLPSLGFARYLYIDRERDHVAR
ncbi:uncharacterized protein LOC127833706 [Dreissena polymorpha]|uniref:Uncharacterized protein n=1 Tax=Dreissena polymorpha TaxID=45954 RepID=A0A9D4MV70_DREPO|nr:uncharacterized protein LOC127833706 [Dreissena polymorpha]KAH3883116.1 hypothetical protein DPMN_007066 [Dreissena polymorpha]